jgi:hypothetical protein
MNIIITIMIITMKSMMNIVSHIMVESVPADIITIIIMRRLVRLRSMA